MISDEEDYCDDGDGFSDAAGSDTASSDSFSDATSEDNHTEKCLLGKTEVQLPLEFVENKSIFMDVMSAHTWENHLTDAQRQSLMKLLPSFKENEAAEKQATLRKLFDNENFKFGAPLTKMFRKLKNGGFSPDIARYTAIHKKMLAIEHKQKQRAYYANLLKEVLLKRQHILDHIEKYSLDVPFNLSEINLAPAKSDANIQARAKKKYLKILTDLRIVGCDTGDSSDEEDLAVYASRKAQLSVPPGADNEDNPVVSTFALQPQPHYDSTLTPADKSAARRAPKSGIIHQELSELEYQNMLRKHRKRKANPENYPEVDTQGCVMEEILSRTQLSKKAVQIHKLAMKRRQQQQSHAANAAMLAARETSVEPVPKKRTKLMSKEKVTVVGPMTTEVTTMAGGGTEGGSDVEIEAVGDEDVSQEENRPLPPHLSKVATSFFALIRDIFKSQPEQKTTTSYIEQNIELWKRGHVEMCTWSQRHSNWKELVNPAMEALQEKQEDTPPLVKLLDTYEWVWIGNGHDDDDALCEMCDTWFDVYKKRTSLPEARHPTNFVVRPSTDEEKLEFQKQETERFSCPHEAYTYRLHGYESVVGPVKGVYSPDQALKNSRAREHAILHKERPHCVNILALVRDAAARLPNGEGTRAEICQLLKDSQYIADNVTDAQINPVVSGALDRLHYEKDPCVKFDSARKIWIYLHRNRDMEEALKAHKANEPKPKIISKRTLKAVVSSTESTTSDAAAGLSADQPTATRGMSVPSITIGSSPGAITHASRAAANVTQKVINSSLTAPTAVGLSSVAGTVGIKTGAVTVAAAAAAVGGIKVVKQSSIPGGTGATPPTKLISSPRVITPSPQRGAAPSPQRNVSVSQQRVVVTTGGASPSAAGTAAPGGLNIPPGCSLVLGGPGNSKQMLVHSGDGKHKVITIPSNVASLQAAAASGQASAASSPAVAGSIVATMAGVGTASATPAGSVSAVAKPATLSSPSVVISNAAGGKVVQQRIPGPTGSTSILKTISRGSSSGPSATKQSVGPGRYVRPAATSTPGHIITVPRASLSSVAASPRVTVPRATIANIRAGSVASVRGTSPRATGSTRQGSVTISSILAAQKQAQAAAAAAQTAASVVAPGTIRIQQGQQQVTLQGQVAAAGAGTPIIKGQPKTVTINKQQLTGAAAAGVKSIMIDGKQHVIATGGKPVQLITRGQQGQVLIQAAAAQQVQQQAGNAGGSGGSKVTISSGGAVGATIAGAGGANNASVLTQLAQQQGRAISVRPSIITQIRGQAGMSGGAGQRIIVQQSPQAAGATGAAQPVAATGGATPGAQLISPQVLSTGAVRSALLSNAGGSGIQLVKTIIATQTPPAAPTATTAVAGGSRLLARLVSPGQPQLSTTPQVIAARAQTPKK